MKTVAFTMKLKPGMIAEYKRRHDQLRPELALVLREAGISDYSSFLDEATLTFLAVQKQSDGNAAADLPNQPVIKKMAGLHGIPYRREPRQLSRVWRVEAGVPSEVNESRVCVIARIGWR